MADYVIAPGKSIITLRGILGPGDGISQSDLKTQDNWKPLIENGKIVEKSKYTKKDDVKKDETKKTDVKRDISGAKR